MCVVYDRPMQVAAPNCQLSRFHVPLSVVKPCLFMS